jgi:hypothetical protein
MEPREGQWGNFHIIERSYLGTVQRALCQHHITSSYYPSNSYRGSTPLITRKPTAQTRAGCKCDLVHFYYKGSSREDDI